MATAARMLVVDDEERNRRLLAAMLQAEGYDVMEAADGPQALEAARRNSPDIVLLDVMMPGMDGYEVARELKADAATRPIPIVIVTSLDDRESRLRGLEAGAEEFVTKPIDRIELRARVRNLLRLKEYGDRLLRMTTELEQARDIAQAATRAKGEFLAVMSHEIRTPMNGVLGTLELLGLTRLEPEQQAMLQTVRESGRSLQRVIDDILDFSKIEAGKLEVRPETVSIRALVEAVAELFSGSARGNGLSIDCSVDPRISPAVRVDPLRLRQILGNFVSNAVKFTPHGGTVGIDARLIERSDGRDLVRFSVTDTGIGVSAEELRKLFQPFSQAAGGAGRGHGGTGLGLTICRQLAGLMGGAVEMQSEPGRGTTMILTLSLPIADPAALEKADPGAERDSLAAKLHARRAPRSVAEAEREGTLVLIADDHPTNRALLERQLRILGYAAESVEDGVAALEKWKSGRFAIVVTDCNMPVMDGYELARSIRRLESARGGERTPIIACTANAFEGEAASCFAAGMDDYLAKPIELQQLLAKLDRWLPGSTAAAASDPLDRAVVGAISGGDAQVEREILGDFRRANDADATLLRRAVADGDIALAARAAHRIDGACRSVGANALAGVCERIEKAARRKDREAVEAEMVAFERELRHVNFRLDSLLNAT